MMVAAPLYSEIHTSIFIRTRNLQTCCHNDINQNIFDAYHQSSPAEFLVSRPTDCVLSFQYVEPSSTSSVLIVKSVFFCTLHTAFFALLRWLNGAVLLKQAAVLWPLSRSAHTHTQSRHISDALKAPGLLEVHAVTTAQNPPGSPSSRLPLISSPRGLVSWRTPTPPANIAWLQGSVFPNLCNWMTHSDTFARTHTKNFWARVWQHFELQFIAAK